MNHPQRHYQIFDQHGVALLDGLLESRGGVEDYRQAMLRLGNYLGGVLLSRLDASKCYGIMATAEDVDFLVKGLVEAIKPKVAGLSFACYWNKRLHYVAEGLNAAPIVKSFCEPDFFNVDDLIVVKAVISSACVVRTNITDVIRSLTPGRIHIVAPVIFQNADRGLCGEFPDDISDKFVFTYLASDSERDSAGNLVPGVGGEIYGLLGLGNQDDKNHYVPELVMEKLSALP